MSEIDMIDHQHCGFFGDIALYRPSVKVDKPFVVDTNTLVLGGGLGEFPALVISRLDLAVRFFVGQQYFLDSIPVTCLSDARNMARHAPRDVNPYLVRYGWDVDTVARFVKMCRDPRMANPYANNPLTIDEWFFANIGEFVFYSLPGVVAELRDSYGALFRRENRAKFHVVYGNIWMPPPGYPGVWGRYINDRNEVVMGNVTPWTRNWAAF